MDLAKSENADVMVNTLADGAAKVLQNANDLYQEAATLHQTGALSRALFLHQISLEECAKIEMLGAWAVSVLAGIDVNEDKVPRPLRATRRRTTRMLICSHQALMRQRPDAKNAERIH